MRSIVFVLMSVALIGSTAATAQRRVPGAQEKTVGVAIDLNVSGTPYSFKGQASCDHLPQGSIYDIRAARWSVRHDDDTGRHVNLSLWRPTSGADMVTLNVSMGGKRYDVSTVKRPQGPSGSGTVTLTPQGAGGTFTINVSTASAAKITGTIKCDAFSASEAVAGD